MGYRLIQGRFRTFFIVLYFLMYYFLLYYVVIYYIPYKVLLYLTVVLYIFVIQLYCTILSESLNQPSHVATAPGLEAYTCLHSNGNG